MSDFKKVSSSFLDAINKVVSDDRKKFFEEQKEHEKLVAEKMLSPKQKKIAKLAGDPNKIDAADFAALRKEETDLEEMKLSAKAARHGEDIGKPGKMFGKIAASAAKKYGSEEAGNRVAGAILKKMRNEGYNAKREHELNMDAAQRHMDRRAAEGEDMTGAKINPKTYEIIMPKSNTKKMAKEEVEHLDELSVDLLKRARDKAERISGDSLGKNPIKMKAYQRQADTFTDAIHKKYKAQLSSGKRKYVEEVEHIDETLGATLRKYVPGLGKEELKKRYLDADTRTRYTLGKAPENHTDADKKELEMHAKKLRRYGKLVDKHIGEAYIHMPVYDKYITDVRRKKGGGSMNFGEFANHHGMDKVPHIINDLKKERNELINKHKSIKVAMLHDRAISGLKSAAKEHAQQNEEVEQLDELSPNTMHNFKAGRREKQRDFKLDPHMSAGEYDDRSKKVVQGLKLANRRLKAQGQSTKTPDYLRSMRSEATDTPGNGREHQCAIHVKNEQFGEGRTLTTQHAEPDEYGNIAWYDVMFEHGIERVDSDELEILVSEAHVHSTKKSMKESTIKSLRDITEGRGRPRKNPDDPKWKKMEAKPAASSDDGEEEDSGPARPGSPHLATEPDKHISVQLKVAQDMHDEKGGADVKFANGKTHFVKHDVASKVLSGLEKLKPGDRADDHDHIAQSHENLMQVHKVLS